MSGGESFMNAIGEELLDSIVGDQIPIYTEQEKYNLTVESTVDRISAALEGREVPGAKCKAWVQVEACSVPESARRASCVWGCGCGCVVAGAQTGRGQQHARGSHHADCVAYNHKPGYKPVCKISTLSGCSLGSWSCLWDHDALTT